MSNYFKKITICLLLACTLCTINCLGQSSRVLDLAPAKWIWYPSDRVLQNTFVLFRKEFDLNSVSDSAAGWILADSRYQLFVNGQRVQWGPAPFDPRWPEADPVNITRYLHAGKNVIAFEVLFYGAGDGTSPIGKAGLLCKLKIGSKDLVSDSTWQSCLPKSWPAGQYKRFFLRSLQEEFDARLFPYGWNAENYAVTADWLSAHESETSAAQPSISTDIPDYQWQAYGGGSIHERSIPMMIENEVPVKQLTESAWITWKRPAEEYFDVMTKDAYTAERGNIAHPDGVNSWTVPSNGEKAAVLTFEFKEQCVGWPHFTIDAPAGTIVEMLVHEAHQPGKDVLINTHFQSWTRFVCKAGVNTFEPFDFESLRWIQLHIRHYSGNVKISNIGIRRRQYTFPAKPQIILSDTLLQGLVNASVNTLYNSAQETVVDGMARERQQYSGDGSHQLHAVYQTLGDSRLPARFIKTFSQGQTTEGFFMDSWPAFDRLARIMERQVGLTNWGPILDHSVGFCFDNYYYYMYTGDTVGLHESFPRLLDFFEYLKKTRAADTLLPVENLGIPSVWMDHIAYQMQRHKQCAFNLYTSAMCINALAPLCRVFNRNDKAVEIEQFGKELLQATVKKYWSPQEQTFVVNLPWLAQEGSPRYCDRSLSTAILFNQCPGGNTSRSLELLVSRPSQLGISYPCNAIWPAWALSSAGRMDIVLKDLRTKWATMASVNLNNTLQEDWICYPDGSSQWSHCGQTPLIMMHQGIAGIKPITAGYKTFQIYPQLVDLKAVDITTNTIAGPIVFKSSGVFGNRRLSLEIPAGTTAELVVDDREELNLAKANVSLMPGKTTYIIEGGKKFTVVLKHT
jgi:alpha-L-rhamnosidase